MPLGCLEVHNTQVDRMHLEQTMGSKLTDFSSNEKNGQFMGSFLQSEHKMSMGRVLKSKVRRSELVNHDRINKP